MYKLLWFILSLALAKSMASTIEPGSPNNTIPDSIYEAGENGLYVEGQSNNTDASQNNSSSIEDGDLYQDEEDDSDSSALEERAAIERPREVVIRCSRRYTPGNCQEAVTPVWTYVFELQNCTERLGCIHSSNRENRFKSLNRCSRTCNALGTIYSKGVELEGADKDSVSQHYKLPRRSGSIWLDNKDFPTLPPLHDSYSDNEGRPVAREYHHYADQLQTSYEDYGSATAEQWGARLEGSEFEVDAEFLNDFHSNFNE